MEGDITVIDPDGDLLIILIPENDPRYGEEDVCYDTDGAATEDGEENVESDPDDANSPEYTWNLAPLRSTQERKFKVSLKHMTMACRRAKTMFSGNWKEATCIYPDGLYHWTIRGRFDAVAFEDVLLLMHACPRNESSPTKNVGDLSEIAVVFDDLQCNPAMTRFYGYLLENDCACIKNTGVWLQTALFQGIHASSVLQFDALFKGATKSVLYLIRDTINIPTHLIAANIVDGLKRRRIEYLVQLNSALLELEYALDEKDCTVCHYGDSSCEARLSRELWNLNLFSSGEDFPAEVPRRLNLCKALNAVYFEQPEETTKFSGEHNCDLRRILLRAFKQVEHCIEGLELKDFVQRQE